MVGPAVTFYEKGQNNNISSACVQNFNNTPTVTLPAAAATRAPVFPAPGWQQRG
jgi:branched-chain amino acid transport system substrate-binding protein